MYLYLYSVITYVQVLFQTFYGAFTHKKIVVYNSSNAFPSLILVMIKGVTVFWQWKIMLLFNSVDSQSFRETGWQKLKAPTSLAHLHAKIRWIQYNILVQQNVLVLCLSTLSVSAGVLVLGKFKSTCTLLKYFEMYLAPCLPVIACVTWWKVSPGPNNIYYTSVRKNLEFSVWVGTTIKDAETSRWAKTQLSACIFNLYLAIHS